MSSDPLPRTVSKPVAARVFKGVRVRPPAPAVPIPPPPPDPALLAEEFERGRQTGRDEASTETDARMAEMEREIDRRLHESTEAQEKARRLLVEILQAHEHNWIEEKREWHGALGRLALELAGRVIRRAPPRDPAVALRAVDEALESGSGAAEDSIRVRLNPRDIDAMKAIVREREDTSPMILEPDPAVEPGGCVVTSADHTWDARLTPQLDRLAESLLECLYHQEEGTAS